MTIFIAWDETEGTPRQEYIGGGEHKTVWDNIHTVIRKAQWTKTETPKDRQGAEAWVKMWKADGDTRVNLRVLVE